MLKKIVICFIVCFLAGIVYTQLEIESKIFSSSSSLRKVEFILPKKEVLKYKIYWEFIPAGESVISTDVEKIKEKTVYHITTKTASNSTIDLVYKVRNQTDSYVDLNGFYSLKFTKDQSESNYISQEYVLFDCEDEKWFSIIDDKSGYCPKYIQDIVSSLFYIRLQKIEVGKQYSIDVYTGKTVYPMIVNVLCKEKIKIKDKYYDCFKLEPKVDPEKFALFRSKGQLFVWITNDKRKIPVKLQGMVFIGSVYAFLDEYKI